MEIPGPDDGEDGETSTATGTSTGTHIDWGGDCALCDGHVECGHCLIQAFQDTYRCPPGAGAPEAGCMNLKEWHRDQYGAVYTCFYCE